MVENPHEAKEQRLASMRLLLTSIFPTVFKEAILELAMVIFQDHIERQGGEELTINAVLECNALAGFMVLKKDEPKLATKLESRLLQLIRTSMIEVPISAGQLEKIYADAKKPGKDEFLSYYVIRLSQRGIHIKKPAVSRLLERLETFNFITRRGAMIEYDPKFVEKAKGDNFLITKTTQKNAAFCRKESRCNPDSSSLTGDLKIKHVGDLINFIHRFIPQIKEGEEAMLILRVGENWGSEREGECLRHFLGILHKKNNLSLLVLTTHTMKTGLCDYFKSIGATVEKIDEKTFADEFGGIRKFLIARHRINIVKPTPRGLIFQGIVEKDCPSEFEMYKNRFFS